MIGALGILSVVIGTAVAYVAGPYRRQQSIMETLGGVLLIIGFALLGYSLECIFGPP